MTTRFSLAELAEMLYVPVDAVRAAVDDLSRRGELTAESFIYQERNWRVAPSDTKKVQAWITQRTEQGLLAVEKPARRIVRRQVAQTADKA